MFGKKSTQKTTLWKGQNEPGRDLLLTHQLNVDQRGHRILVVIAHSKATGLQGDASIVARAEYRLDKDKKRLVLLCADVLNAYIGSDLAKAMRVYAESAIKGYQVSQDDQQRLDSSFGQPCWLKLSRVIGDF